MSGKQNALGGKSDRRINYLLPCEKPIKGKVEPGNRREGNGNALTPTNKQQQKARPQFLLQQARSKQPKAHKSGRSLEIEDIILCHSARVDTETRPLKVLSKNIHQEYRGKSFRCLLKNIK